MAGTSNIFRPQPGFQEQFLSTPADIAFGGGSAGCGKTRATLMESLRHKDNPRFGAEFFRRTYTQIKNTGGLWDESQTIFPYFRARPTETNLQWTFPSKATVKFSHLQYEKDVLSYQGAQIPLIVFDEITHFTEHMFWYMLSRNRSMCGIKPYMRATCNPDPDSFVSRLIEWWIDQETGFPIPERSGVLRYFWKVSDSLVWADSKDEIIDTLPDYFKNLEPGVKPHDLIKSFTFIPGRIYDNKALLSVDPGYLANLMAQDEETRSRLLDGNWKIRTDGSALFQYHSINDIYSNFVSSTQGMYITCDAARFGRDLCVIMVWRGWEVLQIIVMKQSDVHDILKAVESARAQFKIPKSNVLIDQDGVGAGSVRMGGYRGFSGGDQPVKVYGKKEFYKNLKTQCYYRLALDHVNIGDIMIHVNNETCIVDGVRSTKVKVGREVKDIRELIRDDLRAVKRDKVDMDGKFQINGKDEQKVILGRSPDFGDTLMMRMFFELRPPIVTK